jgi:putative tributyrin esterase
MTFITEELPTVIQTLFTSSEKREDNFIMGYAKGSNVALVAAITRPDRYYVRMDISGGIGMTMDAGVLKGEL